MSVTITGEPNSCQRAYNRIRDIVEGEVDEAVAEFSLHPSKHSLVIGSKGKNIRKLSADHSVRIFVPDAKVLFLTSQSLYSNLCLLLLVSFFYFYHCDTLHPLPG